jgi:multicomponent Na+:H+ antiporter subunit E
MGFWMLLTFRLDINILLLGVVFSGIIAMFSGKLLESNEVELPSIKVIVKYMLYLFKEILVSSFIHIRRIVSREEEIIAEIDLHFDNGNLFELVMMANFITLTPGTLSLDVGKKQIKILAIESSMKKRDSIEEGIHETFCKIFR